MQIIDSNDFNLRTAVYLLKRDKLEIVIIPVLHVGSKEFYKEVNLELEKCDLILYEGVGLKGMGAMWKSYQRFAHRLGLSYQNEEVNLRKYKNRLIHADFGSDAAEQEWKKIPTIPKLFFKLLYPIGLTFLSYFETKRSFAKTFKNKEEIDDQFWFMKYGRSKSVNGFIFNKREQRIFEEIDKQIQNLNGIRTRIGIIYGAGHMKKVINYLTENHNFKIDNSWFLTVLWLTDSSFKYKRREE